MKYTPAEVPEDAIIAPDNDPYPFKLADVARECGFHRVTLLRMEQAGKIPRAKWRKRPIPHRVYSADDVKAIRYIIEKMYPDREYVDEDVVTIEK